MQQLPNNCRIGNIAIYPSNWESKKANVKLIWRISYRFFDDNLKQKKRVVIKGMNDFHTLSEKQDAVRLIVEDEMSDLLNGYNRITGVTTHPIVIDPDALTQRTPLMKALYQALDLIKVEKRTKQDIKNILPFIQKSTEGLKLNKMPVGDIRRKHIRLLLDNCEKIKEVWSANLFNHYRKYLSILFNELMEAEAIDLNPVKDIKKRKTIRKLRVLLTAEERIKIDEHLKQYPDFRRFTHIFFHSGARETELLKVRKEDVDLNLQRYKVTIIKGKEKRETWKVIKDAALVYWNEVMAMANKGDYLFSAGLVPGKLAIRTDQITHRWYRLVKKKLGIQADFYSLKHSNTDETASLLSIGDAAKMNSHTSTVITMKHYAIGEKDRQEERLKRVDNTFAG